MISVAVVDDHPLYREGVAATLRADPAFSMAGTGSSGDDAVRLVEEKQVDILLLDFHMPNGGLVVIRKLRELRPDVKIVLLTVAEARDEVSEALALGARGYILKSVSSGDLLNALRGIHAGEAYVTPELAARLLSELRARAPAPNPGTDAGLSAREDEILDKVALGRTNKEIARELKLSEKTVKHYMTSIMQKLHVRNRVEAASLVIKQAGPKRP